MTSINKKIEMFISYRHDNSISEKTARWFKEMLEKRFKDRVNVFLDVDTLSRITNLSPQIIDAIEVCDVMFVIIGPNWRAGEYGPDSIENPDDWVHQEIKRALDRGNKTEIFVIKIYSHGEPEKIEYPDDLKDLGKKIGVELKYSELHKNNKHNIELAGLWRGLEDIADKYKRKPIAFVTSTLTFSPGTREGSNYLDGLDYFTNLVSLVVKEVNVFKRDVVIKVPEYSQKNSPDQIIDRQNAKIMEVLDNLDSYEGLIVAPFDVDRVKKIIDMYKVKRKSTNFPIAAIDKGFIEYTETNKNNLKPIFSMENNGIYNGRKAAECFVYYLSKAKDYGFDIEKSNIVILRGIRGSDTRIKGFTEYINEQKYKAELDIEYTISDPIDYTMEAGRDIAEFYLKESQIKAYFPDRPRQIHAFFCSNDEIAMGVEIAIDGHPGYKQYEHPLVIIGFDSIRAFTIRLDKSEFLLNTIDTCLSDQVRILIDNFLNFIDNQDTDIKVESLEGKLHLENEFEQLERIIKICEKHKEMKQSLKSI